MKFERYSFLFPPRPSKAIPPSMILFYQSRGWVGQYKKNGTCTILYVSPEKEIIVRTRHDDEHKRWTPTDKSTSVFKNLPGKGWYVFVCEVLHSKFAGTRDTIYLFDIVVNDGEQLVGKTFTERQEILHGLFLDPDDDIGMPFDSHIVNSNVMIARVIPDHLEAEMTRIQRIAPSEGAPENEGLVLKDPNARLEPMSRKTSNSGWQVKCRITHANYAF